MLKKTLIAAAAVSLIAFGATSAYAGGGGGGGGGHHHHHFNNNLWWGLVLSTPCHYETQQVRVKFYDRWGNPHFKWVWRDVKVCH